MNIKRKKFFTPSGDFYIYQRYNNTFVLIQKKINK